MSSLSKSGLPRWPSWAGGGDFRRRAESALTHPATVAALGVLLLNDLLFKSLWPHSWLTGKLSDLAWLILALPLLAFLLSFAARRNVRACRLAFLAAYVGLPLLYAAFNTFEPVHDVIMRGISLAGGAAGSPRDATDSLVIPLAWGAALWVWRREPAAPGAMRLRWAVLVAGVAALASVATSEGGPIYGVQRVGVSDDGLIVTDVDYSGSWSLDGGLTWNPIEHQLGEIAWGDQDVETPRGRYILDGPRVLRVSADGVQEEVVYSAEYLKRRGNVWVQKVSTERLGRRSIATQPVAMVYDDRTGNLVLAMGIQGVVVGTPAGEWSTVSVGSFEPTDFSFLAKTRLLLSDVKFWTAALAFAVSMTGAVPIVSQHKVEELLRAVPMALVAALVAAIALLVLATAVFLLLPGVVAILGLLAVPIAAALAISTMPRHRTVRKFTLVGIGAVSVVASAVLILLFGFSDETLRNDDNQFIATAIVATLFGVSSIVASHQQLFRHWRLAAVSFLGTVALVLMVFMLWLHLGAEEGLTKLSAVVLPGIAAGLIARHLTQREAAVSVLCPACEVNTSILEMHCTNCGAPTQRDEETRAKHFQEGALEGRNPGDVGFRMLAGILDMFVFLIVAETALVIAWYIGLGFHSLFSPLELVLVFLVFSLVYNPLLVGIFATTPGKGALKLRVVRSDGSRMGFRRALAREAAKFGPMLLVSAVVMVFRADRRGLHDLLADTIVVRLDGQ